MSGMTGLFHKHSTTFGSEHTTVGSTYPTTPSQNFISKWFNRTVTDLKNTPVYQSLNRNLIEPCRNFENRHPVINTIAIAALTILAAILTFDLAVFSLKHTITALFPFIKQTITALVPAVLLFGYGRLIWRMQKEVTAAWQAIRPASIPPVK